MGARDCTAQHRIRSIRASIIPRDQEHALHVCTLRTGLPIKSGVTLRTFPRYPDRAQRRNLWDLGIFWDRYLRDMEFQMKISHKGTKLFHFCFVRTLMMKSCCISICANHRLAGQWSRCCSFWFSGGSCAYGKYAADLASGDCLTSLSCTLL